MICLYPVAVVKYGSLLSSISLFVHLSLSSSASSFPVPSARILSSPSSDAATHPVYHDSSSLSKKYRALEYLTALLIRSSPEALAPLLSSSSDIPSELFDTLCVYHSASRHLRAFVCKLVSAVLAASASPQVCEWPGFHVLSHRRMLRLWCAVAMVPSAGVQVS